LPIRSAFTANGKAPLMAPHMAYLLLLMFNNAFPAQLRWLFILLHIALAGYATWLFRHHLPTMGRPHVLIAIVVGLIAAWGWVAGQHAVDGIKVAGIDLGGRFPLYPGAPKPFDPHVDYGSGVGFWVYVTAKIARACTIVPVVEEIFWRGFILRAFIHWDRFETVPWGRFAWKAMIGSSLLSIIQHPDNWVVSVGCWLLFNALFYWKKSLLCLMITHAVTNLAVYVYVVRAGDWRFW
jgi:CAAX prenyl protease-like protein